MSMTPVLSPDCRDGNHHKCDGTAWNTATDQETGCMCFDCKDKESHAR